MIPSARSVEPEIMLFSPVWAKFFGIPSIHYIWYADSNLTSQERPPMGNFPGIPGRRAGPPLAALAAPAASARPRSPCTTRRALCFHVYYMRSKRTVRGYNRRRRRRRPTPSGRGKRERRAASDARCGEKRGVRRARRDELTQQIR